MYGDWTCEQWRKVAFSDESSFTVKPTSLRMRVWRKSGTAYVMDNIRPTFKSGYVCLNIWATFSMYGRTPLVRINGTLNQVKYREILENNLLPFARKFHGGVDNIVFQQDNCGPHRAKSVAKYLSENGISLLYWTPQSPDLNPIENAWAILKRRLRLSDTYPSNINALFYELSKIWNALPDSYFRNLVASMGRRGKSVKDARDILPSIDCISKHVFC